MGDWLDDYANGFGPARVETWTPKLVAERLIDAVEWAHRSGGPVGPSGIKANETFSFTATLDDHLEEGWGLPEIAGDDEPDDRPVRVQLSPEQITAHEAALQWAAVYLIPDYEGAARILALWVRCKALRRGFDAAVDRRGTISRGAAYRLRDRGLSIISQGLDKDEVPL